jgi:DNA excision repair protein ERCC-4
MSKSLEYHAAIIEQMLNQDGLVILGHGLGIEHVFLPLVKLHSTPRRVVFVLNLSPKDKVRLTEGGQMVRNINSEFTSQQRQQMYLDGGCFCVTARILTVDLLNKLISIDLIAGFIINNAHRVTESSPEAFILRIFRQINKSGFIYALSDNPESFVHGFSKAEYIMKYLFLTKLYLWPRFHKLVKSSLQVCPDVIEIKQPLTPLMSQIQNSLVAVIDACAKELQSSSKVIQTSLDLTLNVETCLSKAFDTNIHNRLLPVWDKVPSKAKGLIQDLTTLRKCLGYLLTHDCITFYRFLLNIKQQCIQKNSLWILTEAANTLFQVAKRRVYEFESPKADQGPNNLIKQNLLPPKQGLRSSASLGLKLNFDPNPKWNLLTDLLAEIDAEHKSRAQAPVVFSASPTPHDARADAQASVAQPALTTGGSSAVARTYISADAGAAPRVLILCADLYSAGQVRECVDRSMHH